MGELNIVDLMCKFLKLYHKDQLQELKKQTKRSVLLIDFAEVDGFFKEHYGRSFLETHFQQILERCETRLNNNRLPKEYITLLLKDIPDNVELKNLDSDDNGKFIATTAMIKNISEIKTGLKTAVYECRGCMRTYRVDINPDEPFAQPNYCRECGSKQFDLVKEDSEFRNIRYVHLEEPLELRQGGRTRDFKAYMEDYLASPEHKIKAGDVCKISGNFEVIFDDKGRNKGFDFLITLHNIMPVDSSFEDFYISEADEEEIIELSQDRDIFKRFTDSLAPDVYGYEVIKKGIILQLFEGLRPQDDDPTNIDEDRWTIHVLLIGDPGIGKSKILRSVAKIAPKVITINGAGTTQAGVTSTAVKDDLGTWTLEAGAIVLADSGILNIDEFDKLNENVQTALNEPMEDLSVSSSKAGLVQTMTARTSVLAGANPKGSRFSDYENFKKQLDIPDSTLSRFDLVFALRDTINPQLDRELATNIIKKTFKQKVNQENLIDEVMFKKYINYAKTHVYPILSEEAANLLIDTYVNVRQEALENGDDTKPITARDLKCMERLAVARAKVELRDIVTLNDAQEAIDLYTDSLKTIGLDLQSAGVKSDVVSDAEVKIIKETEDKIRLEIEEYGSIPNDVKENIIRNINLETYGNDKISGEDVYKRAYSNVMEDKI